jgi:glutathione-regulated potassium-efflux system protein KefB
MAAEAVADGGLGLEHAVALLGTAVIAAPLFRRLGLGSVLGYLAAGLVIGPYGIGLFSDPEAILHVAELGVVMFLFIIGLEMRPAKLWALRKEIFGLGAAQVVTCIVLLSLVGIAAGLPWAAATIGASGFVLSSTAVIMKMMDDAGETSSEAGQRNVSILLFQDLMIVPLLAGVAVIAGITVGVQENAPPLWQSIAIGVGAVAVVFLAGRYVLNPFFGILARSGAREVMTAAALLVVLGTALLMDLSGLSMAMGAFLAGVLLSDSTFRHQLEADVEPFRGILLALFFISVGMSLNVTCRARRMAIDCRGRAGVHGSEGAIGIYGVARVFKADQREAIRRAALFAQGGEFAFVLVCGRACRRRDGRARIAAVMTAIVIISMALTPLVVLALNR